MLNNKIHNKSGLSEERVDATEYMDILREAVAARNGWKRILARYSPPPPPRTRGSVMRRAAPRAPTRDVATFRDDPLYPRIARAVAAILDQGQVVTPVNVLVGMGLLAPTRLEDWHRGRIPYLEQFIDCNLARLSRLLRILQFHAHELKLTPSASLYLRWGKGPKQRLRFTKTGAPKLEEAYARHFLWPGKSLFHPPTPKETRE